MLPDTSPPNKQPEPKVALSTAPPPTPRVPAISFKWQQYWLCVGFHLVLPLFPLVTEYLVAGAVAPSSAYLVAAMYALSIGASSRNALSFGFMMMVGVVCGILFGISTSLLGQPPEKSHVEVLDKTWPAMMFIAVVFIAHVLERYNRHVADCEPFWLFIKEG